MLKAEAEQMRATMEDALKEQFAATTEMTRARMRDVADVLTQRMLDANVRARDEPDKHRLQNLKGFAANHRSCASPADSRRRQLNMPVWSGLPNCIRNYISCVKNWTMKSIGRM